MRVGRYPPSDSRASIRHDQVLDGGNALSHETAAESGNRDGALAYNMKRVMAIIGVAGLLEALAT